MIARSVVLISFLLLFANQSAAAQDGYQVPVPELASLVDAPATPAVSLSPDRTMLLLMDRPSVPSLAELAAPELRLAGIRFNPENNAPSRPRSYIGITIQNMHDSEQRQVTGIPDEPRLRNVSWSPGSDYFTFSHDAEHGVELYLVDVVSAEARRVTDLHLNDAFYGSAVQWMPDGASLLVRAVPLDRGHAPEVSGVSSGPIIQENIGRTAPARTYQDLLEDSHDEALFRHYMTSELYEVALDGTQRRLADASLLMSVSASPGSDYLLVQTLHEPFSYLVPASRFPRTIQVLDRDGALVREIADLPLAEEIPTGFGSVATGVRSVSWRNDVDATLYWVEALDGGDARREAELRDRLFRLEAPFDGEAIQVMDLPLRYGGIRWADGFALLTESWWSTRTRRTYVLRPDDPSSDPQLLFDLSYEDRYNDPGTPLSVIGDGGRALIATGSSPNTIFLSGQGASPDGDRPFLRELDLLSGETTELFRSEAPYYESVVTIVETDPLTVITSRETVTEPANYFERDIRTGAVRALTDFPHPNPELAGIQKESITYDRGDGVALSATLYLPAGYDAERDGALPALVWAYPREFKSADAAGQVTGSPYRFTHVSYWGAVPWAVRGYAVFDNASMPIVGEGEAEPNDSFVEQLVLSAEAVIDEGVRRGVMDPERVAVAGHSYGAFMTANLLAHSDLFRAGIARSGAFNRTLTPFGFQAEQRTYWEAPEVYYTMSPFMHADKIDAPILLIHGSEDNNSGTFPMQSERYYAALQGMGKTSRLVMLPYESHGYQARESLLHMLWEMDRWMEKYVKESPETAMGE